MNIFRRIVDSAVLLMMGFKAVEIDAVVIRKIGTTEEKREDYGMVSHNHVNWWKWFKNELALRKREAERKHEEREKKC